MERGLSPGTALTATLRLVRPLGQGGMGSVWIAEHTGLRTQVVVKFMSDALASNPVAVARFSREAAAASLVKSPHVVHMIDYGVLPSGGAFIAMELLEGHDLGRRLVTEGTMPPAQVATVVSQVAKALTRAHERGVVHRDIKPDNIFLSDGGGEAFIKVLDFGVAKVDDPSQLSHTKTGASIGTPYYMSPEQMIGSKAVDYRTDLWSLGVVAFEAMTGKRPFDGETIGALAIAICNQPLPVPSHFAPSVPPGVDAWFARACARDIQVRFAGAKEMADAFERAVGGQAPVPFTLTNDARLAQAPTEMEAGGAIDRGEPVHATTARSGAGPSTLGAVSDQTPVVRPRGRRTQVLVVATVCVAAAVGVVSFAARGPARVASAPISSEAPAMQAPTQAASPAVPPPTNQPSSTVSTVAPSANSALAVAPAAAPPGSADAIAPQPKKGTQGGAGPRPSTNDPFGSSRR